MARVDCPDRVSADYVPMWFQFLPWFLDFIFLNFFAVALSDFEGGACRWQEVHLDRHEIDRQN